jgi:hypothetical protein
MRVHSTAELCNAWARRRVSSGVAVLASRSGLRSSGGEQLGILFFFQDHFTRSSVGK